jgi:salicylate hydroxylase
MVIGADGVQSVVRAAVTATAPPTRSGICAFRAIGPADRAPAFTRRQAQTLWIGPGRHLVQYPIPGGDAVNLVAFAPAGGYRVESRSATTTAEEFLSRPGTAIKGIHVFTFCDLAPTGAWRQRTLQGLMP